MAVIPEREPVGGVPAEVQAGEAAWWSQGSSPADPLAAWGQGSPMTEPATGGCRCGAVPAAVGGPGDDAGGVRANGAGARGEDGDGSDVGGDGGGARRGVGVDGEELAGTAGGLGLTALLESLDAATMDEYALVEMVAGYQRVASWAQGRMVQLSGRLARRPLLRAQHPVPGGGAEMNVAGDELAPRLGISRFAARRMVEAAELFRHGLQDTGEALLQGRIDYPKACVLVRMLADQPGDVAWQVQQLVLPDAPYWTVTQLERAVAKAIIAADPHRADARARKARDGRRVSHPRVLPDGMAHMSAVLPAPDAAGLDLALEAAARDAKARGDSRTVDQLRADALALLGHGALDRGFIGEPADVCGGADRGADTGQNTDGRDAGGETTGTRSRSAGAPSGQPASAPPGGQEPAGAPPGGQEPAGTPQPEDEVDPSGGTVPDDASPDDGASPDDAAPPGHGASVDDAAPPGHATPGGDARAPDGAEALPEADSGPGAGAGMGDTGGAFLSRRHMPIGTIGGRRAQIQVTVPLSVLLPPEVLDDHTPAEWRVRLDNEQDTEDTTDTKGTAQPPGDSPARQPDRDSAPGAGDSPARQPEHDHPAGEDHDHSAELDAELVDPPADWYPGPVPAEVAELDGYGPITPDVARALAHAGGTWQRLVTDPLSGALLDVGRTRYRPPAAIADFVRLRDGTCVRPGCSAPARTCQLDHTVPWHQGGITAVDTMGCLCTGDHIRKTSGAFQLHHEGEGTFTWTTPTGHAYRRDRAGHITPLPPTSAVNAAIRHNATFGHHPPF